MKIVVNGREYASREELPPEVRETYDEAMSALADKNGNGIRDVLEMHLGGAPENRGGGPVSIVTSQQILIDGQRYDSLEQVPPDKRAIFEHLRAKLSAWGDQQAGGARCPSHDPTAL